MLSHRRKRKTRVTNKKGGRNQVLRVRLYEDEFKRV